MSKTTHMLLIEAQDPGRRDICEIVSEALSGSSTLDEAGAKIGIQGATLCRWIQRLGLKVNKGMQVQPAEECVA